MTTAGKLESLQRLVTLYAVVEQMHSVELQRMTAAVREAEQAIRLERDVAHAAQSNGRDALVLGDSLGRVVAETHQGAASLQQGRIEQVRQKREEMNETAMEQYVASRLKREQMKRVLDEMACRRDMEENRRKQAASDDRFLARRRWSDTHQQSLAAKQIKIS
ncbi:MAG: hypothetical protein M3Y50_17770 [Acidobacteriota bacterium]|nr:hypothetical protein [Acidobacteriota bacterium]